MTSTDETRGRFGGRLKTNVIDFRPITVPSMSPRIFSRPTSPTSSRFPKDEVYRNILEKTKMDMDKLIEHLPSFLRNDSSRMMTTTIQNLSRKDGDGESGRKSRDRNNNNNSSNANNSCNNLNNVVKGSRPLHAPSWNSYSGPNSTPASTRREESSVDSHTRRIGRMNINSNNTSTTTNSQTISMGNHSNVPGDPCRSPINKKPWLSPPSQVKSIIDSGSDSTSAFENDDDEYASKPSKKALTQKYPNKRSCSGEASETSAVTPRKDVFLKHVFVVNGSVVAFKSFGYENFTNWFGDETMLSKEKKCKEDFFHRELDLWWGFGNKEISLKLYCGNKLLVEAQRPARGKLPAKKFKETVILPNHLSVESLIICRIRSGRLIIEEQSRTFHPTSSTNSCSNKSNSNIQNNNDNNNNDTDSNS